MVSDFEAAKNGSRNSKPWTNADSLFPFFLGDDSQVEEESRTQKVVLRRGMK